MADVDNMNQVERLTQDIEPHCDFDVIYSNQS